MGNFAVAPSPRVGRRTGPGYTKGNEGSYEREWRIEWIQNGT